MKKQEVEESRNYKVVKSNLLIQQSRFDLSMKEQKIILYIISKIKPKDNKNEIIEYYEFKIKEFCEICGMDYTGGYNYTNLKKNIKSLTDKSIWITLETGEETILRWIQTPYINKNSGIIKIKLDPNMKPYLESLHKKFTSYELIYTLAMRSQYAIRIYEILKSYEWKKEFKINVEEFKKMLFAVNYKLFTDFKRKVIDISMKEINELTDLIIRYELIKEGRKYKYIIFNIQEKNEMKERLETFKTIKKKLK